MSKWLEAHILSKYEAKSSLPYDVDEDVITKIYKDSMSTKGWAQKYDSDQWEMQSHSRKQRRHSKNGGTPHRRTRDDKENSYYSY